MLRNVIRFYVEGFREMTLGRTLWAIILIKLFVLFAVLKLFFMPDPLAGRSSEERSSHLLEELTPTAPAITTDPAPATVTTAPAAAVSDPAPYAPAAAATDPGPKAPRSTPAAQFSPAARATNLNNH
ncbi:hypothetical protein B5G09_12365 [Alistipes sp. An54]|nr:hypothetical protein B5G09_12365 [Alistipes sp. An54]